MPLALGTREECYLLHLVSLPRLERVIDEVHHYELVYEGENLRSERVVVRVGQVSITASGIVEGRHKDVLVALRRVGMQPAKAKRKRLGNMVFAAPRGRMRTIGEWVGEAGSIACRTQRPASVGFWRATRSSLR